MNAVYESKKEWVLVLEWAEGGELFAYLASLGRVLHDNEARHYFRQVASAVFTCHQVLRATGTCSLVLYCFFHSRLLFSAFSLPFIARLSFY